MKYLTNSGLSYFLNKIKTYIASQLNSKASVIHTHTKSDITDLPNGYVVDSTLDGTSSNAIANSAVVDALDGKSNTGHTHVKSEISDFPSLATVATSGSYNDLSNKPTTMTPKSHTHGNITNAGAIGSTANKPLITTTNGVITTGSFGTTANTFCQGNDSRLSDARTPTSHTHVKSEITDFPTLSTVATSGSYNDLDDRPTIPTVNNATLKIQKNGTDIKTFTANASSDVTCNITVPTKVSELTNDSGFLTSSGSCNYANSAGSASSANTAGAVSTSVADGSSKDLVYAMMANNDAFRIRCGGSVDNGYVEIATSDNGNEPIYVRQYNYDGGNIGDFTTIARTLTLLDRSGNTQFPGTVSAPTFSGNLNGSCSGTAGGVAWSNVSDKPTIPSKTSELTNDSGFITSDTTKIPLAGSNQISGSLIPSTNNSIDIGSSSKKIKSVFANYLNDIDLSTLFVIMNAGYITDLNDSSLRVEGKIIACSYNIATSNNPTPQASGTCFTLANMDSSYYGIQIALSNKGIYARLINDGQYTAWITIIS